jgi:ubiquinone/menaquinone biosynthesis C-methylase UbiE
MQPVNYEQVAESYDRRYATNDFSAIERTLRDFLGTADSVAELGCGTGHWLQVAQRTVPGSFVVGLDRAWAMATRAAATEPRAAVIRGSADLLPWSDEAFDRVFCINALHHFPALPGVFRECARVTRSGGAFMTVGLDPHLGNDRWWIYDFFPSALAADRARYPSGVSVRGYLAAAGFERIETFVAQHLPARVTFDEAESKGYVDRHSTSQLLVIDDAEWFAGTARLQRERPVLYADLRLYATIGWKDSPL